MAGGVGDHPGGILALCRLIERHGEALEFDLLTAGWSLDDLGVTLSWRDLQVLVRRWQVLPGSALCASVQGVEHWPITDQLLAEILDTLNTANWQRIGKSYAPRPKRFPRPWEKAKVRRFGSGPIPLSKFNDWWDGVGTRRKARGTKG